MDHDAHSDFYSNCTLHVWLGDLMEKEVAQRIVSRSGLAVDSGRWRDESTRRGQEAAGGLVIKVLAEPSDIHGPLMPSFAAPLESAEALAYAILTECKSVVLVSVTIFVSHSRSSGEFRWPINAFSKLAEFEQLGDILVTVDDENSPGPAAREE